MQMKNTCDIDIQDDWSNTQLLLKKSPLALGDWAKVAIGEHPHDEHVWFEVLEFKTDLSSRSWFLGKLRSVPVFRQKIEQGKTVWLRIDQIEEVKRKSEVK